MPFYTYILKSDSYDTYFYGCTKDLDNRIKQHNSGRVRYTKGRRPWVLHYHEIFETRSEAAKREHFIKSVEGYKFLKSKGII